MNERIPCPICATGPRDKTCVVFDDGKVHCHRCGPDGWRDIKDALGNGEWEPRVRHRPEERHTSLADWGHELWHQCRPLEGIALAYLEARCCTLPPRDGDLRWHPEMRARTDDGGHVGPALVALVTDFASGEALTLHRTWIRADGTKDGPGRRLLRGHTKRNGVIRLWPDEAVTTGLALAEGIESALSVAHVFQPVWSAIDAGNLAGLPVVPGIECLTVYADRDAHGVGEASAWKLAERWQAAGREVRVVVPNGYGDANDVVCGGAS